MKFILSLRWAFIFGSFALLLSSCGDDTSLTNGPTLSLASGADVVSGDATVAAGKEFTIQVVAQAGDAELQSITIKDNGANVTVDRLTFEGLSGAGNPLSLTGSDKTKFDRKISIVAHTEALSHTYSIVLTDVDGNTASKSFNISTEATPPTVTLAGSTTFEITPDAWISVSPVADKGTANLSKIEVLINGVTATDLSRLAVSDITNIFTANPNDLPVTAAEKFEGKVFVKSPTTSGNYTYTFKFIDALGSSSSVDLLVKVGTAVSSADGLLLNQSGPAGQGGLDLDSGASLGSSNVNVEIRDMGIDGALPVESNWRQLIAGANGTEVKYVKKGQNGVPETFSFGNVAFKEEIQTLFGNGVTFTKTLNSVSVSDKVAIGDVFVAKRDDNYYIFEIAEINIKTTDNSDNYKINIRK